MSVRDAAVVFAWFAFCILTSVNAAPAPPGPSLAAALSTARAPDAGVAIAVGAEEIPLPNGAAPVAPGLPIGTIAAAYGRLIRQFGTVQAVASSTMVIVNTHPEAPDIYQDMPPSDVFKMLALSLNDGQWQKLTGAQGLGIADLDEKQQSMFKALFPGGSLLVFPRPPEESIPLPQIPQKPQTLTGGQLLQSRLRLSQQVQMMLPTMGNDGHIGMPTPPPAGAPKEYLAPSSRPPGAGSVSAGVPFRAEVPNSPKPSDLDYNAALFRAPISLKGLKTVGDLVARISHQTRTELYADARLESLFLTFVGADRASPADLLPALAFCVTGTFRNVGPAFVLTDDRAGIATREMILEQFKQSVSDQRGALVGPNTALALAHPLADLPLSSDSLTITPAELKKASTVRGMTNTGVTIYLNFEELTPEQQRAAQGMFDSLQAEQRANEKNPNFAQHPNQEPQVSLDGKILLSSLPSLQLQVPGLNGAVDMGDDLNVNNLFMSNSGVVVHSPSANGAAAPPFSDVLNRYRRRAAMVRPRTLQELDSVIAAMPDADLNELWLVVPDPGDPASSGKSDPPSPDARALVTEALAKAGPARIRVLPVLELFSWGQAAPPDALDYTLSGETSAQFMRQLNLDFERSHPASTSGPYPRQDIVSPFAPRVGASLLSLLKDVIQPGVSGTVWRETTVPGYAPPETIYGDGTVRYDDPIPFPRPGNPDYGYTTEARLRFLRQAHVDPIDIGPDPFGEMNLSLPFFHPDLKRFQTLMSAWYKLRTDTAFSLLQRLYATAQQTAAANTPVPFAGLPIIVSAGEYTPQYGSWDDPRRPPPARSYMGAGSLVATAGAARKDSRITFYQVGATELDYPGPLSTRLSGQPPAGPGGAGWDGVVFDFSPRKARLGHPAQSSLELLNRLITILHTQHPAAP